MPRTTNHFLRFSAVILLLASTLNGCTWVRTNPDAEEVRIVPADRVSDCKKLGELNTYTKDKIAGVSRKVAKVKSELETLAKVEASEMGADTIVVASKVINGKQSFNAYRCQ